MAVSDILVILTIMEFGSYTCTNCGQQHENWPALAYSSPGFYHGLSPEEINHCKLTEDLCVMNWPDQTDRFVRCTLSIQVIDHCEDLEYGVWVSLSEKSFDDYVDNYGNINHQTSYFGWLLSDVIGYDNILMIPTNVDTRTDGRRPEIIPHEFFDHPLVRDYYEGITKDEAERRIREMLSIVARRNET